jgi:hypothetical protein
MKHVLHPELRTPQSGTCLWPVRGSSPAEPVTDHTNCSTLPKVNAAIAKGYAK